jgi:hypothetical protein
VRTVTGPSGRVLSRTAFLESAERSVFNMLRRGFWVGVGLAAGGAGYAVLALLQVFASHGDVAIVHYWVEFGIGVVMASCGVAMAILIRRDARRTAATRVPRP